MDKLDQLIEAIEELAVTRRAVDEYPNCVASQRNLDTCRDDLKALLEEVLD